MIISSFTVACVVGVGVLVGVGADVVGADVFVGAYVVTAGVVVAAGVVAAAGVAADVVVGAVTSTGLLVVTGVVVDSNPSNPRLVNKNKIKRQIPIIRIKYVTIFNVRLLKLNFILYYLHIFQKYVFDIFFTL